MRSVCVVGGGTAGSFAALALKRRFPQLEVTLLESKTIPIIGVGEATTTLLPPFLHAQLGLDVEALFREVKPTWKLGIKFEWGEPDSFFTYPFGGADPIEAAAFDGDLRTQSFTSLLMCEDKSPLIREADGSITSLLGQLKWGYHLHNAPFVAFLARAAAERGITHLEGELARVETGPEGVAALHLADGRKLSFELYIDATGFRSLLLEGALGSPFQSYASSLLCDTAVVANVPHGGLVRPYTTAETMNAGWCWRIPVEAEDHRGYVFSSAFLDEGRAIDELRAKNPGASEPWVVRFRSGRHHSFWKGNVVAVGNAYGFVEPLESTALHMVIVELGYLLEGLSKPGPLDLSAANEKVGAHWDSLRWFLAVHYKFNERLDTPFWKAARADVDVSGLQSELERLKSDGPWVQSSGARFTPDDPTFGHAGLMMLLLGQRVDAAPPRQLATSASAWASRVAAQRALVQRALPQAEALAWLRENPHVLREGVEGEASWCQGSGERMDLAPRSNPLMPGPHAALLRSLG